MAKLSFVQIKPLDPILRDKSRGLCHFQAELLALPDAQAAAFHRESDAHGFCGANNHMWALDLLFFRYFRWGILGVNLKHILQGADGQCLRSNEHEQNLYELGIMRSQMPQSNGKQRPPIATRRQLQKNGMA
ncbi:hypothetical protein VB151_03765 [Xanthomonas fragariae]|uniref:hypothetical protein n=1 Tax=Xanthomonas fragariae TaxID=48664 RepID=UPI0011AB2CF9|nr:hypothetical protein [Xanthomonas fragariae]MBL9195927.1 hypothetical protein [Xanthomonas fragariae]MBL9220563.1 hypothetical protein [Xanthomonas fragariae]MDM7571547.1 hypothetical protein [Xanthomonas fragariae]MDM7580850.1 hypothetical protein [Xanthomonas fragariae]MEA5173108.1 hypothetical protein [Xanthomonas fragariae]